jgi:hypothetical protein
LPFFGGHLAKWSATGHATCSNDTFPASIRSNTNTFLGEVLSTMGGCTGDHSIGTFCVNVVQVWRWFCTAGKEFVMPLFEVETDAHIIITWAEDEANAQEVVREAYPSDRVIRMTKRPRDTWVISKGALGLTESFDPCGVARDCLSKAAGDKVHAIRLYMHETGSDLESARKVIESNMVMGW